jgi:steroid delta-isomerase-like uncharacterized protein
MSKLHLILFLCVTLAHISYGQEEVSNKAVVQCYFEEVINKQQPHLLEEIYAEDYYFLSLESGSEGRGLKEFKEFLPYLFKAFPDIHYTIDQLVAEGDEVVAQVTVRGTHQDEYWGYPPSNNRIEVTEVFFYKFRDGKIIENRRLINLHKLYQQLSMTEE